MESYSEKEIIKTSNAKDNQAVIQTVNKDKIKFGSNETITTIIKTKYVITNKKNLTTGHK